MLLKKLINIINDESIYKYKFVNDKFKNEIKLIVKDMFSKLNSYDINILTILTSFLVEKISTNNFFIKKEKFYLQWKQNEGRDIKSTLLMLLPYIDDKESKSTNKKIRKLQQLLWNDNVKKISTDFLEYSRNELLESKLKYGNFSLGLFNNHEKDSLLDLTTQYSENETEDLIYTIIHHNFIAILESLKMSNGKMYVNWINIQPINLNIYKQKPIYLETKSKINEFYNIIKNPNDDVNLDIVKFNLNYNGLYLGDFYNVLRMKFYQEIKKIKWVIFNNENNSNGNKYMIHYLNNILDLTTVLNNENFQDLDQSDKLQFEKNSNRIISYLKIKEPLIDNHEFEKNLMETVLIFFSNNYSYRNLITSKNIKKFQNNKNDDDDIKDNEINRYYNEYDLNDVIKALKDIDVEQLWDYLKETVINLQNTIYGEYLIKRNKDKLEFTKFYTFKDKVLNLKNIYNISKTLSHYEGLNNDTNKTEYLLNPPIYNSLELLATNRFWNSLFNNRVLLRFIKLKSNLSKQSGKKLSDSEYQSKINKIVEDFNSEDNEGNKFWFNLVWECLIKNGLISDFYVNLKITDTNNHPTNFSQKKNYIWNNLKNKINKNRINYDNSYYYLTNCKFKDMKKIKVNNDNLAYLDIITNQDADQAWYTFYAMDWISQINFFKRYMYHQIMYVSGSTGTGKSTQVPKLLMYALKMYDFKNNGRICCTQPRIPPTVENTERISKELGIPIEEKKEKTNNYYLQFKHQYDRHTKDKTPHLQLRMVTDGTLLQEVITNPVMKEEYPTNKKIDGKTEMEYGKNNKWDILIVDEAHEHNTNMDIILTLGRNTCYYNNSVRLIIISATMDDDEPIYRSYFKLINDNFLYPIKRPLITHPFSIDKDFMIYSILMDRKFYISPPGGNTLHKITDIYIDNIKYTGNDRKDAEIAQNESFKIVEQICKKSATGQILLFSTGQREILEAVEYLNKILPPGDIALPYFTALHPNYKSMMGKIDKNVFKIRNFRKNIHKEWGSDYIEDKNVPKGLYKRAIIIATNVAEASITISGLKFVVDNGYAKVNKFDEVKNKTNLLIEKISEASRVQRRGRVGRIASGTVYYLYKKGARENIKPKYKITQDDFHENFLQLMDDSFETEENYYKPLNNQYNYYTNNNKNFEKSIDHQIKIYGDKIKTIYYQYPFYDYLIGKGKELKEAVRLRKYFRETFILFQRHKNGYSSNRLLDLDGRFYLINPKEELIVRNIDNGIYMIKKSNKTNLNEKNFKNFLKNMELKLFIVNANRNKLELEDRVYIKTKLNNKISELKRDTIFEENELFSFIIGSGYNIVTEIIEIISMLRTINNNILSLASKDGKYIDFNNFYNFHKNNKSDLIVIHKIIKLLKNEFKQMKIFKLSENNKDFMNDLKKKYYNLVREFNRTKNKDKFSIEIRNILNYLKNNGKINSNSGFLYMLSMDKETFNSILKDTEKYKDKLIKWCKNNYINYDTIKLFFEKYLEVLLKIITSKKDYDEKLEELNSLEWIKTLSSSFRRNLSKGDIEEKIVNTFLISYSENLAIKLNSNDKQYHLIKGNLKASHSKIYRGSNIDNTLCQDLNSYIFYLNIDDINDENYFNITTKVSPEILVKNLPAIYSIINYKNYYLDNKKIISFFGKNYDYFLNTIRNNWSSIYFLWDSKELPMIRDYLKLLKKDILLKN